MREKGGFLGWINEVLFGLGRDYFCCCCRFIIIVLKVNSVVSIYSGQLLVWVQGVNFVVGVMWVVSIWCVNCGIIVWILFCGLIIVVILLLVLCSNGCVSFSECICVIWKCCYGLMDLLNQVLLEIVSRQLVFGWKLFCICLLRIIL